MFVLKLFRGAITCVDIVIVQGGKTAQNFD